MRKHHITRIARNWKWLVGVGISLAAVLVIWQVVIRMLPPISPGTPNPPRTTPEGKPSTGIIKKDVPPQTLPGKFPAEIPLEPGAKVVQNYTVTTADGRLQATRVFETAKSLEEQHQLYQDFFSRGGWRVISAVNQPALKTVAAMKGTVQVQVSIAENTLTKIKTIDITAVEFGP